MASSSSLVRIAAVLFVCSWSVGLFGCGAAKSPVPVEGVVTLDGKPLAKASVTFDPRIAEQTVYTATTDDAGHYVLQELESSSVGAPAGSYRIKINTARPLTEGKIDESTKYSPELVPVRFRDGSLTFDVPAEGTTEANFTLQSR